MNRYAIYHRRENGTCSRREVSEPTDHAAREYAALVVRMRAAYGERLTVDTIERIEYVKIPTDTEGKVGPMLSLLPTDPVAARIARDRAVRYAQRARANRTDPSRPFWRREARAWAHDARLHATGACRCASCRQIDEAFRTYTGGY